MVLNAVQEAKNIGTLLHITALKAECAVLCSGPLFDKSGLQHETGYLYPWLEALLGKQEILIVFTGNVILSETVSTVADYNFHIVVDRNVLQNLKVTGCLY